MNEIKEGYKIVTSDLKSPFMPVKIKGQPDIDNIKYLIHILPGSFGMYPNYTIKGYYTKIDFILKDNIIWLTYGLYKKGVQKDSNLKLLIFNFTRKNEEIHFIMNDYIQKEEEEEKYNITEFLKYYNNFIYIISNKLLEIQLINAIK